MTPYTVEEMATLEVSPIVNSAKIDDPRCCEPVDSAPDHVPPRKTVRDGTSEARWSADVGVLNPVNV